MGEIPGYGETMKSHEGSKERQGGRQKSHPGSLRPWRSWCGDSRMDQNRPSRTHAVEPQMNLARLRRNRRRRLNFLPRMARINTSAKSADRNTTRSLGRIRLRMRKRIFVLCFMHCCLGGSFISARTHGAFVRPILRLKRGFLTLSQRPRERKHEVTEVPRWSLCDLSALCVSRPDALAAALVANDSVVSERLSRLRCNTCRPRPC